MLSGCDKTKEIVVSDNVKNTVLAKEEDNKIRSEPVLIKKLDGLGNQRILSWIDNENVLTTNPEAFDFKNGKVILCSYNLESGESTEILNDNNITRIYDYRNGEGLILVGNDKQAFIFDPKERKLKEVLDVNREFKDGMPGSRLPKDNQDLSYHYTLKLIKPGYISYASKITSRDAKGLADKAEYTILNYEDNKKYTTESRCSLAGLCCRLDYTNKNAYIEELDKITKLNLETGEKSSMKLNFPRIRNVFDDGTLFVECTEENAKGKSNEKWYKVDFDNNEVIKYDENYDQNNLAIDEIDFKNKFVGYSSFSNGEDDEKDVPMYGKIEGTKFVVTGKLFKNAEKEDCNTRGEFIFSLDHNKFITGLIKTEWQSSSPDDRTKNDEYLFELK